MSLKYAFSIRCDEVILDKNGIPESLKCSVLSSEEDKPKGSIQWVPAKGTPAVEVEVRMYNHLFTVEEPTDDGWESELNPTSEVIYPSALIDPSILKYYHIPEQHLQLERIGFFVTDKDSTDEKY